MMKHQKKLAALCLSAMLLLSGCGGQAPSGAVTVNDVSFTLEDYQGIYLYAKNMLDMQFAMYGITPEMLWPDAEELDRQVADAAQYQCKLLAAAEGQMKKLGLTLNTNQLDEMMKAQEQQMGGPELLDELLGQMHLTREQYRRLGSLDVMIPQLRAHFFEKDADAIRNLFNENFYHCKHVLVMDEEGTPEKEALAKEISQKAKNGEDFDQLIETYNEDPGMQQNPDGYVFTEGDMVEPFYEGTKALEVNEISDPVRTDYGWHIILRLPLEDKDFDQNKNAAEDHYFFQLLSGWVDDAKITLSPEAQAVTLESLRPAAPEAPESGDGVTPAEGETIPESTAEEGNSTPETPAETPAEK